MLVALSSNRTTQGRAHPCEHLPRTNAAPANPAPGTPVPSLPNREPHNRR